MNYQVIFYDNEQNVSVNHVQYFEHEPNDEIIFSVAESNNSKYVELFEDVNDDQEYKRFVASYNL